MYRPVCWWCIAASEWPIYLSIIRGRAGRSSVSNYGLATLTPQSGLTGASQKKACCFKPGLPCLVYVCSNKQIETAKSNHWGYVRCSWALAETLVAKRTAVYCLDLMHRASLRLLPESQLWRRVELKTRRKNGDRWSRSIAKSVTAVSQGEAGKLGVSGRAPSAITAQGVPGGQVDALAFPRRKVVRGLRS